MKKIIVLFIISSVVNLPSYPYTYINKTFLTPRPPNANMSIETSMWHSHISNEIGNKYGMTLQISPFYQESTNKKAIGKYFGIDGKNVITISNSDTADFPANSIVHNPNHSQQNPSPIDAKVTINPKHRVSGALLGLFYDLSSVTNGLFLKAILPIVNVDTKVNLCTSGITQEEGYELRDYFRGDLVQTDANRQQAALTAAKIRGRKGRFCTSDALVTLGYNFLEGQDHYAGISIGVTIPASTRADGKLIFEPLTGNGDHLGLHFGADAAAVVWEHKNFSLECILRLLLTHLFTNKQKRVLGLKSADGSLIPWGFYRLGGKIGTKGVFPLANILRTTVSVCPGNQLEAMGMWALTYRNLVFNLGAEAFGREGDHVKIKEFNENLYGLVVPTYDPINTDFSTVYLPGGETLITKQMLDRDSTETPSQLSVKIFASAGYTEQKKRYPIFAGLGASYEFAADNSILRTWGIWGTLGVSF
jgi:hypothetical protein